MTPVARKLGPSTFVGIYDTDRTEDFEVDPRGDFFGDYEDYSPEEFGLGGEEDGYKDIPAQDGDSDDDAEIDETSLEPIRLPSLSMTNSNDTEASSGATQGANRLWGGAEVELKNKPYSLSDRRPGESVQPIFFKARMGDRTLGKNSRPKFN